MGVGGGGGGSLQLLNSPRHLLMVLGSFNYFWQVSSLFQAHGCGLSLIYNAKM